MNYQAKQYAEALFECLETQEQLEFAVRVFRRFKWSYEQESSVKYFFDNPEILFHEKKQVVEGVLEQHFNHVLLPEIRNIILLMVKNFDLFKLSKTIYILKKLMNKKFNILEIKVHSPSPLGVEVQKEIKETLGRKNGSTVIIREKIDPEILGGLIFEIDDTRIDASIRTQLHQLIQSTHSHLTINPTS